MPTIGNGVGMSGMRVLVGFLVAPGVPALLLYLIGLFFVPAWEAAWGPKILVIFAYFIALVMGAPAFFVMRQKGINSFIAYLVMGVLIGLVFYVLFFGVWALISWQSYPEHALILLKESLRSGVIAVVYAAVASVIFWLIAVRQT